ncbi:tryptophan N-monooxygenase CYP79A68 [Nymphaea colorata]|nr:tryptophan N-monooxygenase CYP79A68 [Nymphaea colorata]
MNISSSIFLPLRWPTTANLAGAASAARLTDAFLRPTIPTTLFLILASFLFFLIESRRKQSSKLGHVSLPPGPSPWPIVGNLPELWMNRPAYRWILGMMKEMDTKIACIRLGNVHVIPVTCPEIGREFLKKNDAVFASRPLTMGTEYSSRGFLSIAVAPWGDQWKKMRKVVASEVINPARLRWMQSKRIEEADNLVYYLYNQCPGGATRPAPAVIDVRMAVRQYSGNVIRKMMFGKRYFGQGREDGGPGKEEVEHVDALFNVLSLLYAFCVSDYMPCLRRLDLDGHERMMKKAIEIVNKYHEPVIDERIKKWRGDNNGTKEVNDLLDVLVSVKDVDGKPLLNSEEIKAQASDLIYAAVDNPSNAIEWAMAEMLNRPEILEKATEELDRVVGKDRWVQESDFPHLNYVKSIAREAFRLHPIAPFNLPHVSSDDATVAGYFIPKGSHVLLSRLGLGRNPDVWPNPLRFDPDRHLSAEVDLAEPDLRFISFSTGRRGCMGVALGTSMTVMLLARMLQGFDWSLPAGVSAVELRESATDLGLFAPLMAAARPRLQPHLYRQSA